MGACASGQPVNRSSHHESSNLEVIPMPYQHGPDRDWMLAHFQHISMEAVSKMRSLKHVLYVLCSEPSKGPRIGWRLTEYNSWGGKKRLIA